MIMMMPLSREPVCWRCRVTRLVLAGLAAILSLGGSGCAALSNPVYLGIPARRVPQEYLAIPKDDLKTIPLTALGQPKSDYRMAPGDVLGVHIDTVLGDPEQSPIVQKSDDPDYPPGLGYPIPVRDDGTISLPYIAPIDVKDKTLAEIDAAIKKAYTFPKKIINPEEARVLVSLIYRRSYTVQVLRQETPQSVLTAGAIASRRQGIGAPVPLAAYKNDVLNVLTRTGGLPSLDALNEVAIQRRLKDGGTQITRIPLRIRAGDPIPFKPSDVLLETGDVVFVEGRETEVYYVEGLPIAREFSLPRDRDLRVIQALAVAQAPLFNGGINQNNLNSQFLPSGIGSPSPSNVSVLRKTKDGGQIIIIVNLNKAANDPREDIIVMPGDHLVMQETVGESMTRYFTGVLRFNFQAILFPKFQSAGSGQANVP